MIALKPPNFWLLFALPELHVLTTPQNIYSNVLLKVRILSTIFWALFCCLVYMLYVFVCCLSVRNTHSNQLCFHVFPSHKLKRKIFWEDTARQQMLKTTEAALYKYLAVKILCLVYFSLRVTMHY